MSTLTSGTAEVARSGSNSVLLNESQLRAIRHKGFVSINSVAPLDEVAMVGDVIRGLLARKAGFEEGALHDIVDPDDNLQSDRLTELSWPHRYAPQLRSTAFFDNALTIARQVLGPEAAFAFDHAIYKPAHHGAETAWHQDEAYWSDANRGREQIAVWMPVTEATIQNGCMRYLPLTTQQEILRHRPVNNDPRAHGLECIGEFEVATAEYCPLPPGGAAIHTARTLHSAGPNLTDRPRLAYILVFSTPPRWNIRAVPFEWLVDRDETAALRRRLWLRRGGFLVVGMRALARGTARLRAGVARYRRGVRTPR